MATFILVRNYALFLGHIFFSGWDRCVTKHDLSLVSILPFAVKLYRLLSATGCSRHILGQVLCLLVRLVGQMTNTALSCLASTVDQAGSAVCQLAGARAGHMNIRVLQRGGDCSALFNWTAFKPPLHLSKRA